MEWFTQNASAIIAAVSALLGSLIAALIALTSSIVNIRAARQQREELFNSEKWKANRQLYLEKGEETIALISSLQHAYTGLVTASTLDVVASKGHEISETVKGLLTNKKSNDDLDRIDTLITAYFPTLLPIKEEMVLLYQKGVYTYMQHYVGKIQQGEAAIQLLEISGKLNEKAKEFKAKISLVITEHLQVK